MNQSEANNLRPDLQVIAGMIAHGASVLDLGCGKGELLAHLVAQRMSASPS